MKRKTKQKKQAQLILGIDDAGRGPLIGPMALAGCIITQKTEEYFKKIGVKDSKLLFPKKREFLAKTIRKNAISYHVELTHPYEIDERTKMGTNLNKIEAIKAAAIINMLIKDIKKKIKIIIDCPSPNRESWRLYVLKHIFEKNKKNIQLSCEHKADKNHIAVSAASILAKSAREYEIEKIRKQTGKDFGSGYSHDPKTIDFLKKYSKEHQKDGIFRETWATFQNHKKEKEQKKLGEF
jgi:ribonuclease HII